MTLEPPQPPGRDPDVDALVEQARNGRPGAINELLAACRPLVFRWALVQLADPDDAEDVTQSTMIKTERAFSSFRGQSRWTTWLYRLTSNTARDFTRRQKRRGRLEGQLASVARGRTHGFESDPDDVVRWVTDFLESLTPLQRQAVDLVDLQGRSPSEAAEMMEATPSTFRVHLHRGRMRLRTAIEERSESAHD